MERPKLVLPSEANVLCVRVGRAPLDVPLWVRGSLDCLAAPAVAIVGTRAPSVAGRRLAFEVARSIARAGVCVVSGLALGIDAAAHEGALAAGAPTVGVLGGGHGHFFPKSNAPLGERIIAGGGAVVSPYAPEQLAKPHQFLQRNAIVAGLTDGVVVVEAAARSGALNTANHAANLGIAVMAIPGDVDRVKVAGCLALLRDGAILVRDASDVLEAIGIEASSKECRRRSALDADSERIVAALDDGELDFDALLARLRLSPSELGARLVELELAGVLESRSGTRYGLK